MLIMIKSRGKLRNWVVIYAVANGVSDLGRIKAEYIWIDFRVRHGNLGLKLDHHLLRFVHYGTLIICRFSCDDNTVEKSTRNRRPELKWSLTFPISLDSLTSILSRFYWHKNSAVSVKLVASSSRSMSMCLCNFSLSKLNDKMYKQDCGICNYDLVKTKKSAQQLPSESLQIAVLLISTCATESSECKHKRIQV